MCGIFGVLGLTCGADAARAITTECTRKLRHRGPDDEQFSISADGWCALGFARLSINDPAHGVQPMHNDASTVHAVTNGEIYNHEALHKERLDGVPLHSHSDCEVILPLFEQATAGVSLDAEGLLPAEPATALYDGLRGVFASLVVDEARGVFVAARDPIGVRPLFYGTSADGAMWFASEAKALMAHCGRVTAFPPGHVYLGARGSPAAGRFVRYYTPAYAKPGLVPTTPVDLPALRANFERAVTWRLMSDVPVGVFISGGLDSSLVASVAKKHLPPGYTFHSFSCGLEGSPDIAAAQKVADYLGTTHHVCTFTVAQGIEALKDVITHLETYDVTTIRASTPMFLLSAEVRKHVKVVLSGEGADEVLAGYAYMHNAPTPAELHEECLYLVNRLHTADVLRGDRSTAAHCLELRVPFLDRDFVDMGLGFDPADKSFGPDHGDRMEKWAIRQAFTKGEAGNTQEYLPTEILWRQKEQFSDGVGYNWIDGLRDHCAAAVSDEALANAATRFTHDPPKSKEAYFYRDLFEGIYGLYEAVQGLRASIQRWVPKWSDTEDPSGRVQKIHVNFKKLDA